MANSYVHPTQCPPVGDIDSSSYARSSILHVNNLMPWITRGVLHHCCGVSRNCQTKVLLLGVSSNIQSRCSLGLKVHRFGERVVPIAVGSCCNVPISYDIPSLSP